jgi:hypothetical protein
MSRGGRWFVYLANLLVGGSGLLYLAGQYGLKPQDEFSLVHPYVPELQHAHILLAPILVWAFGHLFYQHAWIYWRSGQLSGRRSGLSMLLTGVPMILSGYAIQISLTPAFRIFWVWVHLITGGIWIAAFVVHGILHFRERKNHAR